ncbi:helix-turn-helix domain-containing protein [Butyricicoccus sp. Marseille-Q5471]|uniref:helix-turn-helix domain-containing protein n=1 Tax=Butyricicoccus sp. Marseille-Q5471 TaxID=3039493 RepID=UPI0024BC4C07|nr:helix-turn-helix transcriptional regulator [Butyricicoccus sp. Marseille-Q5471]
MKIRQDLNLGNNLRTLRKQCGLTQDQVSAKLQLLGCDVSRAVYSRYETGELNIRVSDLIALKHIFNCQYEEFFDGLCIEKETPLN